MIYFQIAWIKGMNFVTLKFDFIRSKNNEF